MMPAATALDWHGVGARYRRLADGAVSARLRELARPPYALDAAGVDAAWGCGGDATRTVLAGVRRVSSSSAPRPGPGGDAHRGDGAAPPWGATFEGAVARIAAEARAPVLALGGGLDAAATLVAWCRAGAPPPPVLTLATGLAGYDEIDAAMRVAAACGVCCARVEAPPSAWLEALPRAVVAMETPLYNLHPVGRYLLALEAKRRGHDTLITGDGADAAFAALPDLDYVPRVAALGDAAGLSLRSAFLEDDVLAATLALGVQRDKAPLRRWLRSAAPAVEATIAAKRPRTLPALDLHALLEARRPALEQTAQALGRALRLDDDRHQVGWLTLELLVSSLREPR
jgi:hypothetical protein